MIHFFKNSIATIKLPDKFTYPFHYTPHPLCIIATKEVQAYLTSQSQWQKELQQGKMFGVLIVQTPENKIGYLAAFSGTLAGKNCHPFFVPPIYDLLQPQGFFKIEEERISAINVCIKKTQNDPRYIDLLRQIEKETIQSQQELTEAKEFFKSAKKNREIRRKTGIPDAKELAAMIRFVPDWGLGLCYAMSYSLLSMSCRSRLSLFSNSSILGSPDLISFGRA